MRKIVLLAVVTLIVGCTEIENTIDNETLSELSISKILLDGAEAELLTSTRTTSSRSVTSVESFEVDDIICIEQSRDGLSTYYYYQLSSTKRWSAVGDNRLTMESIEEGDELLSHFIPGIYDIASYSWMGDGDYPDIMRDRSVEIVDGGLVIDYERLLNGKLQVITSGTKSVQSVTLNSLIRLSYYEQSVSGMDWAQEYCSAQELESVGDGKFEILLVDLPQRETPLTIVADGSEELVADTGDLEIELGKVALLYLKIN